MTSDPFDLLEEDLNTTPEEHFYRYLTSEKMPKLYNCEYWLRHQLAVFEHIKESHFLVTKPSGPIRVQVSIQELVRSLLEYYFLMYYHTKFHRTEMHLACDMGKFLDIVMTDPTIKKYLHPKPNAS
jgi:hypothetical protein